MTLARRIPRPSLRSTAAFTATGVIAAGVGAVVATTAGAATTSPPNYREAVTCSVTVTTPAPRDRKLATKLIIPAGHSANGTIAVPQQYKDPATGLTYQVQQWVVDYGADGLGAHGKVGALGGNVGGQLSRSPIGIDISTHGFTLVFNASTTPVPYTFQDSGPVNARISINTYIGAMTRLDTRTYAGKTCPPGTTPIATIDANGPADPSDTPTSAPASSASPTPSKSSLV